MGSQEDEAELVFDSCCRCNGGKKPFLHFSCLLAIHFSPLSLSLSLFALSYTHISTENSSFQPYKKSYYSTEMIIPKNLCGEYRLLKNAKGCITITFLFLTNSTSGSTCTV